MVLDPRSRKVKASCNLHDAHLPTGSVSIGDLPFPLADWSEKRMFSKLNVALEV